MHANNEMCERGAVGVSIARRSVLKLVATAAAGLAIAQHALAADVADPPKAENVLSPDAALDRLMAGNARYVEGVSKRHDFKHEREALSKGQNPFAAVLSCADSRIAPEYCFDTARGDVFVCRVAGNFASQDIVASLEYTVTVLNTPLILVLGHESCGAIEATIKSIKDGTTLPGHMAKLVTALAPAVNAVQGAHGDLLANAIRQNVTLNVEMLKTSAPILKSFADDKRIRVVGGIYQLKTGRVQLVG
jgi:carbonic anhydrase